MPTPKRHPLDACESSDSCEAIPLVSPGKFLRVTDPDTQCEKNLDPECSTPSIPVQVSADSVELRDGSYASPIQLPQMQRIVGGSFSSLMIMLSDGTIKRFSPNELCGRNKLIFENGKFSLEEDTIPDLISTDICEGGCDDVDYVVGAIRVPQGCPDGTTRDVIQLKLIPRCCCDTYLVGVNDDAGGIE